MIQGIRLKVRKESGKIYDSSVVPGVQDPQQLIVKEPRILGYSLKAMQDRVNALIATGCSLQQVLEMPVTSSEVLDFVLTINPNSNFFACDVNTLREGLAFLKKTGVSKKGLANGLKHNVCSVRPGEMQLRCQHLTARLGLSNKSLTRILKNQPGVLARQPARLDINLRRLEGLGFSASQVQSMATRQPTLLTANWDTALQKEKWHVLSNIMHMPLERLAT
ncbi:hypothetical protein WJX79_007997 [Trebouxia sp. C0005]